MDGEISPADLEAAIEDGDAPLVVDIRQPEPFRRGHVPDSVNIPLPELARSVDRVAGADHVVTVCPHGKASVKAARLIAAFEDFDGRVESLDGGLTAWDGPVSRGSRGSASGERPDAPF